MTQTDEEINRVLGLENLYCENDYTYPKKSGDLIQSLTNYQLPVAFFTEPEQNNAEFIWKHKRSLLAKAMLRKTKTKMELEESGSLTSDYISGRQESRQYATGTKTEI